MQNRNRIVTLTKLAKFSPAQWVAFGYAASQCMRFGLTLLLTRLLAPEIYAISAVLSLSIAVIALATDLGLNERLQQHPNGDDPDFVRRVWSLGVVMGVIQCAVLAMFGAPLIALIGSLGLAKESTLASPNLSHLIAIYSVIALLSSLEAPGLRLAHRQMMQRKIVAFEIFTQAINSLIILGLAFYFKTIEAVIAATILGGLVRILYSYLSFKNPSPRIYLDKQTLQAFVGFSPWIWLSSLFAIVPNFFDRVFFATTIPIKQFGLYVTATGLVFAFEALLLAIINRLALPKFSRTLEHSPHSIKQEYYRFQQRLDVLVFGFVGFTAFAAESIIRILFDARYLGAGSILQVACFQIIAARFLLAQKIAIARGTVWRLSQVNFVRAGLTLVIIPLVFQAGGLYFAIVAVALCAIVSNFGFIVDPWFRASIADLRYELRGIWVLFPASIAGWVFHRFLMH